MKELNMRILACILLCLSATLVHAQSPSVSGPATAPEQDVRRQQFQSEARKGIEEPSAVVLYGLLDTGVEMVTNVGPAGAHLVREPALTGSLPSRWGIRVNEDLGGGLQAIVVLESGLLIPTGGEGQGGRLFGRQSFVGFAGKWGAFTLGRQYTMLFWSLIDADVLGPNIYGIGSLDSYIPNARADNAVVYRGTFNGLTIGSSFSLGRDTVNAGPSPVGTNCPGENASDPMACREWSALLKYDQPRWGAALAADEFRGGPGAFAGLISSKMKDRRVVANGYVRLGGGLFSAGLVSRENQAVPTPHSDLWFVGASYPLFPAFTLDAEAFRLTIRDSANKANLFALRGTYNLSKRTALYATAGRIQNDGALADSVSSGATGSNPRPGTDQSGTAVGLRITF
jgi:predicted porin